LRLPKTVQEAYEIDADTVTDLWHKDIAKEMKITLSRLNLPKKTKSR